MSRGQPRRRSPHGRGLSLAAWGVVDAAGALSLAGSGTEGVVVLAVLASGASGAGEAAGPTGSAIRSVPAAAAISDVATDPDVIALNRSSVGHVVPTPARDLHTTQNLTA